MIAEHGYTLIHPFDNWDVIAGQGTAALELIEQAGPFDLILCPVGGGGLLAGTALAVKGLSPRTRVVGAEPKAADDALRSFVSGTIESSGDPQTVADGLRTSLGERPFRVIRRHVDAIVTATEPEILAAMRFVWERFKIIIEPSCSVPVAPILNRQLDITGSGWGSSSPAGTSTSNRCSPPWREVAVAAAAGPMSGIAGCGRSTEVVSSRSASNCDDERMDPRPGSDRESAPRGMWTRIRRSVRMGMDCRCGGVKRQGMRSRQSLTSSGAIVGCTGGSGERRRPIGNHPGVRQPWPTIR